MEVSWKEGWPDEGFHEILNEVFDEIFKTNGDDQNYSFIYNNGYITRFVKVFMYIHVRTCILFICILYHNHIDM